MAKTIVHKFGGASVKDSNAIKNLLEILRNRLRNNSIIVVSAMGKMTNLLESIVLQKIEGDDYSSNSTRFANFHLAICEDLFPSSHPIFSQIENEIRRLKNILDTASISEDYDALYDRVVCFGELFSSRIVMEYLCQEGMTSIWYDARQLIQTNSDFRFAKVNWEHTRKNCEKLLKPILFQYPVVTQGFIAGDTNGKTTTLGREGSDFSAAILATTLDAASVTIWKDVPGVLNGDPKLFQNTSKFNELGYKQAAEMTFYGASVIHPKTIKPLAQKRIPLFVKSFLAPDEEGTKIHQYAREDRIPTFILKNNQILISFHVKDFTFIEESHLRLIYTELDSLKLKVNMLQTAAISISIVIDSEKFKLKKLLEALNRDFSIFYNENLELLTILNGNRELLSERIMGYDVLLEQETRHSIQVVRSKIIAS